MVYVSGGSQGCNTCRRRKKKCDLGRPECQRCFTTGRKCEGYTREPSFVILTARGSSSSSSLSTTRLRLKGQLVSIRQGPTAGLDPTGTAAPPTPPAPSSSSRPSEDENSSGSGWAPLSPLLDQRPALNDSLGGVFRELLIPEEHGPEALTILPGGWLFDVPALFHGRGEILNSALLALYTGFIGRQRGDPRMANHSLRLYVDSIGKLRRRQTGLFQQRGGGGNNNGSGCDLDVALASALIFSRCELLAFDGDGAGYAAHVQGGLEILQRSAGRLPDTPFSKLLFRKFRCLGFYYAVRHRKAFFMARPPFDALFLAEPGEPDYVTQRYVESMALVPALMEEADKLGAMTPHSAVEARSAQRFAAHLLRLAGGLDRRLEAWRAEMERAVPAPAASAAVLRLPPGLGGDGDGDPGGVRFQPRQLLYRDWKDSYLWSLYWAMSIYVGQLIGQLQRRYASLSLGRANDIAGTPVEVTAPALPPDLARLGRPQALLDQHAENICGSVFSGISSSPLTAQETMVGVFTAQWYYTVRGDADRLQWCVRTMRVLEAQGLAMGVQIRERPGSVPVVWSRFIGDRASLFEACSPRAVPTAAAAADADRGCISPGG